VENNAKDEKLFSGVVILNSKIMGLSFGIILGLIIFIATNWLVIKGGHVTESGEYVIGPHMQLLGQFFIGYSVSFLGSIIGFFYGFAIGTICGAVIGWIYNKIVELRN
jgi:hypothetical protein